jgi:hypothetical protein
MSVPIAAQTCTAARTAVFRPGKNNQCSEPQAEYVRDKLAANYCDYFEPNNRVPLTSRGGAQSVQVDDVRKNFDDLFKKK